MSALTRVALMALLLTVVVGLCPAPAWASDVSELGIAPGDVVLGNISNFPGHAGIFIGRWRELPERLQAQYADVFKRVLIRSRDHGLKDSYLVVDSIGGRGVTLRSFTEEFTGYLPNNHKDGRVPHALHWEAKTGGAVAWPGLEIGSSRRWAVVEEALKAARAGIPYDGSHMQEATLASYESRVEWVDGIKVRTRDVPSYQAMRKIGLDCISLVHVVYWRGAEIDLDVSWMPWHTPEQLYDAAKKRNLFRAVLFEDAFIDAAVLGKWKLDLEIQEIWTPKRPGPITETVWLGRDAHGDLTFRVEGGHVREPIPLKGKYDRTEEDAFVFESENLHGAAKRGGVGMLRFTVDASGALSGTYEGRDPADSDGEGGGRFRATVRGIKVRDLAAPPPVK